MGGRQLRRRGEWSYRHWVAAQRARNLRRLSAELGEKLILLSQCEVDLEQPLRALQDLLEELALAQRLITEFDCAQRVVGDEPGTS